MDTVLFLCVNNGGRSQMAEAFFNHLGQQRGIDTRAESAGTRGVGVVHPLVLRAMGDAGLSIEGCVPKQLTPEMVERATRIISVDPELDCERSATKFEVLDRWALDDPSGKPMAGVCAIRDEITRKVVELLDEVAGP